MLKLRELRIGNLRSHKSTTVRFLGPVTVLVGPNAAGKSSIGEAIQVGFAGRTLSTTAGGVGADALVRDSTGGLDVDLLVTLDAATCARLPDAFQVEDGTVFHLGRSFTPGKAWSYRLLDKATSARGFDEVLGALVGDRRLAWAALAAGGFEGLAEKDRQSALEVALGIGQIPRSALELAYATLGIGGSFIEDLELVAKGGTKLEDFPLAKARVEVPTTLLEKWLRSTDARRKDLARLLADGTVPEPVMPKPDLKATESNLRRLREQLETEEAPRRRAQGFLDAATSAKADADELVDELRTALEKLRGELEAPVDAAPVEELEREAKRLEELRKVAAKVSDRAAGAKAEAEGRLRGLDGTAAGAFHCPMKIVGCEEKATADRATELEAATEAVELAKAEVVAARKELDGLAKEASKADVAAKAARRTNDRRETLEREEGRLAGEFKRAEERLAEAVRKIETHTNLLTSWAADDEAKTGGGKTGTLRRRIEALSAQRDAELRLAGEWEAFEKAMAAREGTDLAGELEASKRLVVALAPDGLRRKLAAKGTERLVRGLAAEAEDLGVPGVEVQIEPFAIRVQGRELATGCSESERWRVEACLQIVLAKRGLGIVLLDRLDVLQGEPRGWLLEAAKQAGVQVIALASTPLEPEELPAVEGVCFAYVSRGEDGISTVVEVGGDGD